MQIGGKGNADGNREGKENVHLPRRLERKPLHPLILFPELHGDHARLDHMIRMPSIVNRDDRQHDKDRNPKHHGIHHEPIRDMGAVMISQHDDPKADNENGIEQG